jgi:hypothetical protein
MTFYDGKLSFPLALSMTDHSQWDADDGWATSPFRTVVLVCLLSVGVTALTAIINPTVSIENVRALLTTVAIIEASILAIVFSVTVVALQLVVNRYSARLSSIFVEDPLLLATLGLFAVAIGVNLVGVYLLPGAVGRMTNAAIGLSLGLAAGAVYVLYTFVSQMIQRGSPDELIRILVDRKLAPEWYLPTDKADFESKPIHPVLPLYQTISSAIDLGEYQTAKQGIEGIEKVLLRSMDHFDQTYDDEEAAAYAVSISEEILTEYVPSIIEQALSKEQYELASTLVECVEAIGEDGVNRGYDGVLKHAADGLGEAFTAAPMTVEANRIRETLKESLLELSKIAVKNGESYTGMSAFGKLHGALKVLLRRKPEVAITERLVGEFFGTESSEIFDTLLDRYHSDLVGEDHDWLSPTQGDEYTLSSEAENLRRYWRRQVELSDTILRYRVTEGRYPILESQLHLGWKSMIHSAADHDLPELATMCCRSMIWLAYYVDSLDDDRHRLFTRNLAETRRKYGDPIVDRAFELLKQGKGPEGGDISVHLPDSSQPQEGESFIERIEKQRKKPEFGAWVREYEREVQQQTELLEEKN